MGADSHIWTLEEIKALRSYGEGNSDPGWFYGLAWTDAGLTVVEVYPGIGFDPIDRETWGMLCTWATVQRDLENYRPETARHLLAGGRFR